jgi:mono/diheme cytochrome c family protein
MLMLTVFLTMFACEEKTDEFSILTGGSNEPSSEVDTNDTTVDTGLDTGTLEPSSEETDDTDGGGVMSEQECTPSDNTVNEDPNNLVGRPDCGYYTYAQTCTGCHGADGEGTPSGQQLVGHIDGHPDSDLIRSIVEGEGSMPPYDNMHPQSVADVVAYMRREFQQ